LHCLNQSFSLFDEGGELVTGDVNPIKACESLSTLSLVNDKLDLSPVEAILVGSQIGLQGGNDSSFDAVLYFF
jgi:hypothetical protein